MSTRRRKVYKDIERWSTYRVTAGAKGFKQSYSIRDSEGNTVAFIQTDGDFFMYNDFGVILCNFNTGLFPNTGELKQAVRYAYLLHQKPIRKKANKNKYIENHNYAAH